MRCFLAVPVPEAVREEVERLVARLRPRLRTARFVAGDSLHLTLHFFADLDADGVEALRDAAREGCAASAPFEVALGGLGVFPDARRPKVLWIGACQGARDLAVLQALLARGLAARGLPLEDRPYRSHLTLARFREPDPAAAAVLALGDAVRPPPFPVADVVLFESVLGPAGAVHSVVDRFPLRG